MLASPAADPILQRFRAALDTLYRDRIERVVLFGSRARGDAREDSDYDVAVLLKNPPIAWGGRRRSGAPHHRRDDVLERGRAQLLHRGVQLFAQDFEHALDAGLTERTQPPQVGPPDADRAGAER
jgi:hypothetical protein